MATLNNLSSFFDIRGELTAARDSINDAIRYNENQMSKIDKATEAYHEAGRVNKALACIDRLEKAAERQGKADRPSTA